MTADEIVENLINDEPGEAPFDPKSVALQAAEQANATDAAARQSGVVNPTTVKQYGYIYHKKAKRADGTACAAKVTSIRTWKRDPGRWEIGWKYGMYEYGTVTPHNADEWTTVEPPPVPKAKARR
jgi:hypothetical protein